MSFVGMMFNDVSVLLHKAQGQEDKELLAIFWRVVLGGKKRIFGQKFA